MLHSNPRLRDYGLVGDPRHANCAIPMIDPSQFFTNRAKPTSVRDEARRQALKILRKPAQTGSLTGEQEAPTRTTLSVIFPAFNEEGNIRRTVESAIRVLPTLAEFWEIIIVDDGSTDGTASLCEQLVIEYPGVKTIHHPENKGYGAALRDGILSAQHEFIFFSDSDGQFDLSELKKLIRWSRDYDIVIGYRAKRQDPPHRLINALGWHILMRVALGLKVHDIDCAFKLFNRAVFDRVQIRSVGAMVNAEILAQAASLGMRIHEVPVSHFPRRCGKPSGANVRVILKAFGELLRLQRRLRHVTDEQRGLASARNKLQGGQASCDQRGQARGYSFPQGETID